jgi:hypothetical protein
MYLHIGANQMIDVRKIVAIFKVHPIKSLKSNPINKFCNGLNLVKLTRATENESINCYIVTEDCIYGTPISLQTISKRYEDMVNLFAKNNSKNLLP